MNHAPHPGPAASSAAAQPTALTNAQYLARYLESRGVTHVYELIGGMITFLLDALHQHSGIRIISMHHEQGAGFAAEGHARMTGVPAVALATSGPGATNLLTCIGSCYFDSVPAVFITGQVNRHEQKKELPIRQLGFQETDIVSICRPVTKAAFLVEDPEHFPELLDRAFRLACAGRPGPVLIDIPMDVQRHVLTGTPELPPATGTACGPAPDAMAGFLGSLGDALQAAARPLVLAGGGVRSGGAIDPFRALIAHLQIPTVHSLMGVDTLPGGDRHRVGMIGSYGNRWANQALGRADLVLVLGSRLDIRQTGADVAGFSRGRRFFHVDCDAGELNNRVKGCTTLAATLAEFLPAARSALPPGAAERPDWCSELANLRAQSPDTAETRTAAGINPNALMHALSRAAHDARAFVCDVGQHQMWAAQSLALSPGQRFLTSGGMGAMGFALPAGIGAAFAAGLVVVIAGDGGFQLNLQELQTIVRNQLPVKIVVLNNRCHGMVRQFQESYFKERYQSTLWGYDAPDFCAVAHAYGLLAVKVSEPTQVEEALAELMREPQRPALLEVIIPTETNAYPKLAFGRPFGEMEPAVKPLEMEGT
jgi:acetolactate synthase-1/2/3 large subunit